MNPYKLNTSEFGTHQLIAREINNAKTILDVGCNEGYLKTLTHDNTFVGIDYSKQALQKAKKQGYAKVIHADLNDPKKIKLRKKFDIIIFADVLEHLLHPETVLKYFPSQNLKPEGKIIISLPNVANFTIRFSLLLGRFNYTQAGILDKTHLHLYTIKSSADLVHTSGLKINKTIFSSNRFGGIIKAFPALGGLLGHNIILVCQKS